MTLHRISWRDSWLQRLFTLVLLLICTLTSHHAFPVSQYTAVFVRPRPFQWQQQQKPIKPYFSAAVNDCREHFTVQISSDQIVSRPDAVQLLDNYILPTSEKGYRMNLNTNDVIDSNMDMDSSTYGEFTLSSLDILLDRMAQEIIPVNENVAECSDTGVRHQQQRQRPLKIIDIGSGCGRLVLYMAIAQQRLQQHYDHIVVVGIEQSKALFDESIRATERLLLLQCNDENKSIDDSNAPVVQNEKDDTVPVCAKNTEIRLYCGAAAEYMNEIHSADIVICYSTAFSSGNFLPSLSALLLSDEWNTILTPSSSSSHPHEQTSSKLLYCVTMDKALDPSRGWTMIDRINVPNPEIGVDSMAFLQQIDRSDTV